MCDQMFHPAAVGTSDVTFQRVSLSLSAVSGRRTPGALHLFMRPSESLIEQLH